MRATFRWGIVLFLLVCVLVAGNVVSPVLGGESIADLGCCVGTRGNVNALGTIDLTDLAMLIAYLTVTPRPTLPCPDAANVNGQGSIDLTDLSTLIGYLTITPRPILPSCPTDISPESRMAVVNGVIALLDSLGNNANSYPQIVTYLQEIPEIETAGIVHAPSSLWALFTDGVLLVVSSNRNSGEHISAVSPTRDPSENVVKSRDSISDRVYGSSSIVRGLDAPELPLSGDARLLNTLGPRWFNPITGVLADWLSEKGYASYQGDETVEALRTVGGDGVFFFSTHGGAGFFNGQGTDSAYSLWTSTIATTSNLNNYRDDLLAKRLSVQIAAFDTSATGDTILQAHYGITSRFVDYYWSDFSGQSMVYIDACGSDGAFAQPLKRVIMSKKAGTYFGWTQSVYSDASNLVAQFMFDRLLGSNTYTAMKETPPQRPFDYVSVYDDLVQRGLHAHPTGDSGVAQTVFQCTPGANEFGLLAPSIKFLTIDEAHDTLFIAGFFGSDPGDRGRVKIGGTETIVHFWEPTLIRAFIPNSGAGSVGTVVVEVDPEVDLQPLVPRASNEVNITEWTGDFVHIHNQAGSLTCTLTVHAHFRADIHSFREVPGKPPVNPVVLFDAAQDSYGEATATGNYTREEWPGAYTTYTWSGSAYMPGVWEDDIDRLELWGSIDPVSKLLVMHLSGNTRQTLVEELVSDVFPGYTENFYMPINPELMDDVLNSELYLSLTDMYHIPAGQRDTTSFSTYDPFNPATYRLKWNLIQSSFAPDTSAAR